jgi:XTP/dITP diphosphohydrolase
MKLCFATNNQHKLQEIQSLLGGRFELLTLEDIGCTEEIPETSDTIAGNSLQKAQYIWEKYGINGFADDTGLEVFALNGEPGVVSARYAGPQRSAADNMALLEQKLQGHTDRSARFVTVITLVREGQYHHFEGVVSGKIISEQRGSHGFGYDPVFVPDGQNQTLAEMTLAEKSLLSHRARAFDKLCQFFKNENPD